MRIQKENAVRKIDSAGRVIIPKGLRDRLGIEEGDEMQFYSIEDNGNCYIGIGKEWVDPRYEIALSVLNELGTEPPPELIKKIEGID